MRHFLTARHRSAPGAGLEAFQNWTVLDECKLDREGVSRKVIIVLSIRDRALECFGDQLG